MRTTIYLVRHGDVHNPNAIMYERLPGFQLSDLGRKQAHDLGKFLADKKISTIYASPLERTHETANIIASYHPGIAIAYDERLLEVSTTARGKKVVDLEAEHWNFYTQKYLENGGEHLSDIWKRMSTVIREIVRKHKGQEIVVVSHGDPLMVAMVKHLGKRLTLASIRGQEYIQTAKGFRIIFEEFSALEVAKLDF